MQAPKMALFGPEKEDRHADAVLNATGRGTEKHVSKEAVSVGAHGDEVTAFLLDPFDNFLVGFTVRQFGLCGDTGVLELRLNLL